MDRARLREEIARLREQPHRAVRRPEDFRDEHILALSRRLDRLVVEFVRACGEERPVEQLALVESRDPAAFP